MGESVAEFTANTELIEGGGDRVLREKGLKAPSDMHFKQDLHDPGLRAL